MGNQEHDLLLGLVLSLIVACLLIFIVPLFFTCSLYFFTRSMDKQSRYETERSYAQSLLTSFEVDRSGSLDHKSDFSVVALGAKNEYLKAKLLLAEIQIQTLGFERQQSQDIERLRNATHLSERETHLNEGNPRATAATKTSRNDEAATTGDLLGLDDEKDSDDWSQKTLNSKGGRSPQYEAKLSSPSSSSDTKEPISAQIQTRYVDDTDVDELPDRESSANNSQSTTSNSSDAAAHEVTDCYSSEVVPSNPPTKTAAANFQRKKHLSTIKPATMERMLRPHPSHSPSTTPFIRNCASNTSPGIAFHDSRQTLNGTNPTANRRPTPNALGLCLSKWAGQPDTAVNDLKGPAKESIIAAPSPSAAQTDSQTPQPIEEYRSPYVYKYMVQHVPLPGSSKDDLLCTFTIAGLPAGFDLENVMDKVRGGLVVSCVLLNTTTIAGSNTAMVAFFQGQGAKKYVEFANIHIHEIFGLAVAGKPKITVSLVQSSTYIPYLAVRGITKEGWTRHLVLKGVPESMTLDMVRSKLAPVECKQQRDDILSMWRLPDTGGRRISPVDIQDGTDYIHIVFASIISGHQAFLKMMADDRTILGRCHCWCERDPCDAPVEELITMNVEPVKQEMPDCSGIRSDDILEPNSESNQSNNTRVFPSQKAVISGYNDGSHLIPIFHPDVKDNLEVSSYPACHGQEMDISKVVENSISGNIGKDTELDADLRALCDTAESSLTMSSRGASMPDLKQDGIDDRIDNVSPSLTTEHSSSEKATDYQGDLLDQSALVHQQQPLLIPLEETLAANEGQSQNEESPSASQTGPTSETSPMDYSIIPGHTKRMESPEPISLDEWLVSEEFKKLAAEPIDYDQETLARSGPPV